MRCSLLNWSGGSDVFVAHPITSGLTLIGGVGGENWSVQPPAQVLSYVDGYEFVVVAEYGAGKIVLVANHRPFRNSASVYDINYGDNALLVKNIWAWLLD